MQKKVKEIIAKQRFRSIHVIGYMKKFNNILFPMLFGLVLIVVFNTKDFSQNQLNDSVDSQTHPVYYTHRFEMELHKDTMFYSILILEGWDLIFPIFCNSWYPTCGGCIVYDNWPYPPGFPYPSFDKASMIGWPLANTNQDTLSSSADSLFVAKEPTVMPDSVTIAPSATVPTPSRWTRFKQKVRSFRIFSSS